MKFKKLLLTSLLASLPITTAMATITTERVSLDKVVDANLNDNGEDTVPSVSANGRYIAYQSAATDVVAETNGISEKDIFVYDRSLQVTTRVSQSSTGQEGNADSLLPDITHDGRYVVFASAATNLTAETDTNGTLDIFLHDRTTNQTTLVTKVGSSSANGRSTKPVIAGNGRYVTYESQATNLSVSDNDSRLDIYRYDIHTGSTVLVSVNNSGVKGNFRSEEAAISDNGQLIAFASDANNFGGSVDNIRDIFVRNLSTSTTTAITYGAANISGQTNSQQPGISADGNLIVFETFRQNFEGVVDNNGVQDVYIYNLSRDEYRRVSQSSLGVQGDARSGHPDVSSDGRYVVFESSASNLVPGDTNGKLDVFIHDLDLARTTRISVDNAGAEGTGFSHKPKISQGGNFIGYSSTSPLDTANDTNNLEDTYLATLDFTAPPPPIVDPTDPTDTVEIFSDFNGDGRSDVLWQNEKNGETWISLMNGRTILANAFVITVADLNWKVVGVGDFDGDAKDDILWRNQKTGGNYVLLMNGVGIKKKGALSVISPDWKVSGIGDFDNDGKFDVFWSNSASGEHGMYLMDGIGIKKVSSLITAGLEWQVGGLGDYDNDGKSDILWSNSLTGEHWIFLMNGTVKASSGPLVTVGLEWEVAGIGDFNADGKSDSLWRNNNSGQFWVLLMNGAGYITSKSLLTVPSLSWEMKQVGDFDGDLKSDTLWRNSASGQNWQVQLNGPNIKSSKEVNTLSDLNWKIKGQQEIE